MISSSENSVNNWWESDGPMKGIYQDISDLLSPSALPNTSCTDDYERDNIILNTTSLTWWSNRNTISLHCHTLTWQ